MIELRATRQGRRRRLFQVAVRAGIGVIVLWFAGYLLDGRIRTSPDMTSAWAPVLAGGVAILVLYRLAPWTIAILAFAGPIAYSLLRDQASEDVAAILSGVIAGVCGAMGIVLLLWSARQGLWLLRYARGELSLVVTATMLTPGWRWPYYWSELRDVGIRRFRDPLGWTWQLTYRVADRRGLNAIDLMLFGSDAHGDDVRVALLPYLPPGASLPPAALS